MSGSESVVGWSRIWKRQYLWWLGRRKKFLPHPLLPLTPIPLTRDALLVMEPGDRQRSLESYFRTQVATVMGCSVSQLDLQQPLSRLGLDSLMVHRVEAPR